MDGGERESISTVAVVGRGRLCETPERDSWLNWDYWSGLVWSDIDRWRSLGRGDHSLREGIRGTYVRTYI